MPQDKKSKRRRAKGEWIQLAKSRTRAAAPTPMRSIEECLRLPRKVRTFGKVTYPKVRGN